MQFSIHLKSFEANNAIEMEKIKKKKKNTFKKENCNDSAEKCAKCNRKKTGQFEFPLKKN